MALFDTIRAGASGAADDYEIERSIRCNGETDDAYFKRTSVGSPTNLKIWTVSLWIKRDATVNGNDMEMLFGNDYYTGSISTRGFQFAVGRNDFKIETFDGASSMGTNVSSGDYRDPTAWMHIVCRCDTTQGTQSNRMRVYTNGTDIGLGNSISQNQELTWNKGSRVQYLGCHDVNGGATRFFRGYIAEAHFIDGQSLDPTNFAETDAVTGCYKPIKYTGTYGNNGWYLNFSDNSNTTSTTLGKDSSGNGNNFTPYNFSVSSGVGNDSVLDTPTNNWCTLNSLARFQGQPPQDGNLRYYGQGGGDGSIVGTHKLKAGKKYYWEFEYTKTGGGSQCPVGITDDFFQKEFIKGGSTTGMFAFDFRGGAGTPGAKDEGSVTNMGSQPNSGDICGIALDLSAGKMYAHKANSYYNSGNPDNGTGAVITGIPTDRDYLMHVSVDAGGGGNETFYRFNFGQQGFSYQPSTFTDLLNSASSDEPTAPNGSKYFDALLYTGNGSNSHAISGLNFSPDWVWIKARNATGSHAIFDTVRGATKRLGNSGGGVGTDAESTVSDSLKSFDSNGFTFGNENGNNNGETYTAWCWNAGGSTATNTNGGITSQVRANTTAGFSIVSYTGTGSNSTVGHGLGVAPKLVTVKMRSASGNHWVTWIGGDSDFNGSNFVYWDTSASKMSHNPIWNNTVPTSTVFSVGTDNQTNQSGITFIAYVFAEIEGFSKFGQYKGNGSSDGTFVHLGFRPRYVVVKRSDSGNHWVVYDSARSTTNVMDDYLRFDTNNSESSDSQVSIDFVANGFKFRSGYDIVNAGSGTYVYMAFAENAFKYARAR